MQYKVYHDESKENGYWHGMLLVPQNTRHQLLSGIEKIRAATGYDHHISFKNLRGRGQIFNCTSMMIRLGVAALAQTIKEPLIIYDRKKTFSRHEGRYAMEYIPLIKFEEPITAKFILFKIRGGLDTLDSRFYPDNASKVERTFVTGLKGGLHLLFDEVNPCNIQSVHFHGHEQYRRHIERDAIIGKLEPKLRSYITFDKNAFIDDRTGDHRQDKSQENDDCQFLQLTDLLVSASRAYYSGRANSLQKEVFAPLAEMLKKLAAGPARMKNSRWHRGMAISEGFISVGWHFDKIGKNEGVSQLHLSREVA